MKHRYIATTIGSECSRINVPIMHQFVTLVITLALWSVLATNCHASMPDPVLLRSQWEANRDRAHSGRIEYQSYTRAKNLPEITRELFVGEFDRIEHAAAPLGFKRLVNLLDGEDLDSSFLSNALSSRTFQFDSEGRTRTDSYQGISIFDGELNLEDVVVDPNGDRRQITIGEILAGSTWRETFGYFSYLPNPKFLSNLRPLREADGYYVYVPSNPRKTVWVSKNTGDIHKVVRDWENGITQAQYQGHFEEYDGVRIPRIGVETRFEKNKLVFASIRLVIAAEFNLEVPADTFVVSAGKGDTILDLRGGERRSYFAPAAGNATTLVGLSAIRAASDPQNPYSQIGIWISTTVIILCVLAIMWKKIAARSKSVS